MYTFGTYSFKVEGTRTQSCTDAASYCGIRDSKYPDRKSMGYPFDRLPRDRVDTLQQFLTPNMTIQDVKIQHTNEVRLRNAQQSGLANKKTGERGRQQQQQQGGKRGSQQLQPGSRRS